MAIHTRSKSVNGSGQSGAKPAQMPMPVRKPAQMQNNIQLKSPPQQKEGFAPVKESKGMSMWMIILIVLILLAIIGAVVYKFVLKKPKST